jgi:hypothetical protein
MSEFVDARQDEAHSTRLRPTSSSSLVEPAGMGRKVKVQVALFATGYLAAGIGATVLDHFAGQNGGRHLAAIGLMLAAQALPVWVIARLYQTAFGAFWLLPPMAVALVTVASLLPEIGHAVALVRG